MLTCIAVLLICYIQIKEIYLFSFKKFGLHYKISYICGIKNIIEILVNL